MLVACSPRGARWFSRTLATGASRLTLTLTLSPHRNSGDGSFKTGDALTDIVMTLALMVGLRLAEEEGLL